MEATTKYERSHNVISGESQLGDLLVITSRWVMALKIESSILVLNTCLDTILLKSANESINSATYFQYFQLQEFAGQLLNAQEATVVISIYCCSSKSKVPDARVLFKGVLARTNYLSGHFRLQSVCVIALLRSTVVIRQVRSTLLGRPWKPKGLWLGCTRACWIVLTRWPL